MSTKKVATVVRAVGIDTGKNTLHMIGLDEKGAIVLREKVSRQQITARLVNVPRCLIGIEAGMATHYMARELVALGHEVKQVPPAYSKPFRQGHKNDFRDAHAVAEAVQRPSTRCVPIKTDDQLDLQALHRVRSRLVGDRTAVINQLRGFLLEHGIPVRQGHRFLRQQLPQILARRTDVLSPRMVRIIADLIGDWGYTPNSARIRRPPLPNGANSDSTERMIRPGFLDIESRQNLIELARDGSAAHRLARRANALVLLDDGMSCEAIAKVLLLDDDTIRTWYRLYEEDGIEGLTNFSYEGSACQLSGEQQEKLKAWVATSLPRTTRQVGAWIENEFGVVYEGRSGLIALLHRLGLEYHKPNVIPRKLDEEKQKAFIEGYEKLLNSLGDDEAVLFADAVHPTHAARPVGCWAPSQEKLAIEQTSGRQRINIHGAIDLETGQTRMIEALTIDAASTIRLLQSIEALYPMLALIHVFLDNARYHHAKLVQEWLALPGRRIKLHFIPTYCPHLNPIERLWGLMHRNVTHNKCYATCAQFADATLSFLREKVPGNWADLCDSVTDNFRIINPKDFRVMT